MIDRPERRRLRENRFTGVAPSAIVFCMKSSRMMLFVATLSAPLVSAGGGLLSQPRGAFAQLREMPRRIERQEAAAFVAGTVEGGALQQAQLESGQIPVEEAVEQPDSPAADAVQGDVEAQSPAAGPAVPEAEQPSTDSPPAAEQPAVEP